MNMYISKSSIFLAIANELIWIYDYLRASKMDKKYMLGYKLHPEEPWIGEVGSIYLAELLIDEIREK